MITQRLRGGTFLLKVKFALSGLRVYKITTEDLYHSVGKIVLSSMEHIERIDFSEWTQEREDFWVQEGFRVDSWQAIEI